MIFGTSPLTQVMTSFETYRKSLSSAELIFTLDALSRSVCVYDDLTRYIYIQCRIQIRAFLACIGERSHKFYDIGMRVFVVSNAG